MGSYTYGEIEVRFSVPLTDDELKAYSEAVQIRCSRCPEAQEGDIFFNEYDPDGWRHQQGGGWGDDAGCFDADHVSFVITTSGKVYDLETAIEHYVHSLPPHIMCEGEGFFETEGEHWGIRVKRREIQQCAVDLVMAPWKEEKLQTAVYQYLDQVTESEVIE